MSLTISNQGNADLPKLAKGVYHGTCFRIVDLGESIQEYKGEKNKRKRVHISFEITEAVDPSDNAVDMDDGRPFAVSKTYTASLFENAALRIDLQAWRGKSFTEEELNGFDIGKLLGCTARIEVGHTEPSDKGAGGNPKILSLQRPDGGIEQGKETKNDKQKLICQFIVTSLTVTLVLKQKLCVMFLKVYRHGIRKRYKKVLIMRRLSSKVQINL